MSLWAPPTMSFYVCVTLLTNHQQICVLTCAQPTWSLTEFFPYSADHSPTLWRHRWQEASEILCTKTSLFWESWATKNIVKKTRKCSLRHETNVVFSEFHGWRRKKNNHAPRGFFSQTFLEVVFFTADSPVSSKHCTSRLWNEMPFWQCAFGRKLSTTS